MQINKSIFRSYDIRGVVNQDLDVIKVEAIGKAYGTFLQRRKVYQIVVGRDCRLSGLEYQQAFIKGVLSTGVDCINLGMVMTQMVYFAQYLYQTNGACMVTASHNPANYNGFKLAIGFSRTTEPRETDELLKTVLNDGYYVSPTPGHLFEVDIQEAYIKDILKRVKIAKPFKIVVDTHHGAAGAYVPEVLRRVGCQVITRFENTDGSFPAGTPDPTDAVLMNGLAKEVLDQKADMGLAFDGDGDRIGLVDEKGHVLWNDIAVAIFSRDILTRFPGSAIVYNTLCSQVVDRVIKQDGGVPVMWKTGHAFIKSKVSATSAVFGGELSGHFFFNDNFYGHDDGAYSALRIIEYLALNNKTLSQVYESFPPYVSSPEIKIGCPNDVKNEVISKLSVKFKSDFPQATITDKHVIPDDDGVRADFDDGMMIYRASQNGPYITVKFEATTQEVFETRRTYVREMLHSFPQMIWQDALCVNLDFVA